MNYQHITENERYQIYALKKAEHSISHIAQLLSRHKSTISRELARNGGLRGYRPRQAQCLSSQRRQQASARLRIDESVWHHVEISLREEWSPEQICGRLTEQSMGRISHEYIYQYVYRDKAQGGDLYRYLRCQRQRRKRIGDWEGDTVIGRHHRGAILSLVERKSQLVRLLLLPNRKAGRVGDAITHCLQPLVKYAHTLTLDNGKEFAEHQRVSARLQMPIYFADPYCAWQRGLNEQINGVIR